MKHSDIIKQMTLEEKASLCDGLDYWHSQPVERVGIKSFSLNDGPHGIRKKGNPEENTDLLKGVPAICFPTASATACSCAFAIEKAKTAIMATKKNFFIF